MRGEELFRVAGNFLFARRQLPLPRRRTFLGRLSNYTFSSALILEEYYIFRPESQKGPGFSACLRRTFPCRRQLLFRAPPTSVAAPAAAQWDIWCILRRIQQNEGRWRGGVDVHARRRTFPCRRQLLFRAPRTSVLAPAAVPLGRIRLKTQTL